MQRYELYSEKQTYHGEKHEKRHLQTFLLQNFSIVYAICQGKSVLFREKVVILHRLMLAETLKGGSGYGCIYIKRRTFTLWF